MGFVYFPMGKFYADIHMNVICIVSIVEMNNSFSDVQSKSKDSSWLEGSV